MPGTSPVKQNLPIDETPDITYGRLKESAHFLGYSKQRAIAELTWLLEDNRWQQVSPGYRDISTFLRAIDLSDYDMQDERAELVQKIKALQPEASNRAIAEAIGVSKDTINRDVNAGSNEPREITIDADFEISTGSNEPREEAPHVRGTFGTSEEEWYTPAMYIKAAKDVLGTIDLDPASSLAAQETIQAKRFFTAEDDGLIREWPGHIWLNPPYTQPLIEQFVDKLIDEYISGHITEAILLTHNYTDTAWFHKAEAMASRLCFTRGRIKFVNPEGKEAAPTQGQAFFYLGNNPERFSEVFSAFGFIR